MSRITAEHRVIAGKMLADRLEACKGAVRNELATVAEAHIIANQMAIMGVLAILLDDTARLRRAMFGGKDLPPE